MDREEFEKLQALTQGNSLSAPLPEPAQPGMQFGFDVVEVQRVGLQTGDVLMVTVKNDDLNQASVDQLRKQLQLVFPDNKVFVFAMGTSDDVQLSIVSQPEKEGCSTTNYCNDCNCGKKEAATSPVDEHMARLAEHAEGSQNER